MYLELMTTAVAVQRDLATAYTATGRLGEVGMYFVAVNRLTLAFFERMDPPENARELHQAFLDWQRLGIEGLEEELQAGTQVDSQTSRRLAEASLRFTEAFSAFATSAVAAAN